jgi:hypothetical protein
MRNYPWRHRTAPDQDKRKLYHAFSIQKSERDLDSGLCVEGLFMISAKDLRIAASAMQPGLKKDRVLPVHKGEPLMVKADGIAWENDRK